MTTGTQGQSSSGQSGGDWMNNIQRLQNLDGQFHVEYRPNQQLAGQSGSVQPITVDAQNFEDCVSQLATKAQPYIDQKQR